MVDDRLWEVGTVEEPHLYPLFLLTSFSGVGTRLNFHSHRDGCPGAAQVPRRRGQAPYPGSALG